MSPHPVESLSAFLDDELPDAERRGVAAHLAACPSCTRHLRELAAVESLARGIPPAAAPDGYLEALPGRVRRRIRADRPAATRAPWVWPLAAGLALAVLAPLVLREGPSPDSRSADRPAVVMEEPAAPVTTAAPEESKAAAAAEGTLARSRAASKAPQRETAPAPKVRDAFVAPPPAAHANESDRAAQGASGAVAGALVDAPPAAAPPAEQEALAAAGRRKEERADSADAVSERIDAAPSLKKADAAPRSEADALRRSASTPQDERRRIQSGGAEAEKAFLDNASLPASTPEEARTAREAWRRFVSLHSAGPRADEGRVRFIEAAVAVSSLTRDEGDRAIAEREAGAYLALPGAPQAARVKAALRRLDEPR